MKAVFFDFFVGFYELFNSFLALMGFSYGLVLILAGSIYSGALCFIGVIISNICLLELKKKQNANKPRI